ncbi:protein of unknown function [Hyphomicrobium sp. MC1]|nr:protein of unknown function [Hyphomicrobium sp. MC1]
MMQKFSSSSSGAPGRIRTHDPQIQVLFSGRGDMSGLTTRQYARLVQEWVASIGLDPTKFGTHSLRRTKAVLICRRTCCPAFARTLKNRKHGPLSRH